MRFFYCCFFLDADDMDSRHSKKLYAWETGPVDDVALMLLCGECDFKVSTIHGILPTNLSLKLSTADLKFCLHRPQDQVPDIGKSQCCSEAPTVAAD